jgi:hypothetical protein
LEIPFVPKFLRGKRRAGPASPGTPRDQGAPPPGTAAGIAVDNPASPSAPADTASIQLTRERVGKLAQAANALWRLRRRLCNPQTGQPLDDMRRPFRDLETAWDALKEAGIEIRDHTGDAYDPGYSLVCLAFQPTAGLGRETVIETVKPTITILGQLAQTGEIIVGIPDSTAAK